MRLIQRAKCSARKWRCTATERLLDSAAGMAAAGVEEFISCPPLISFARAFPVLVDRKSWRSLSAVTLGPCQQTPHVQSPTCSGIDREHPICRFGQNEAFERSQFARKMTYK